VRETCRLAKHLEEALERLEKPHAIAGPLGVEHVLQPERGDRAGPRPRIRVIKWVVVALLAVWLLYMFVSYAGA
jgi:hypothetical protein